MTTKLTSTVLAASAVAVAALVAVPTPSQAATLRMHTFIPPVANPAKTFLIPWAKKIEKDSGGALKV